MDKLNLIVEILKELNDPKYANALSRISSVCQKKADILKNIESIQMQYNTALKDVDSCNKELEDYAKGVK
jgi:peptidoglycan hydrolase CwlO-like protein